MNKNIQMTKQPIILLTKQPIILLLVLLTIISFASAYPTSKLINYWNFDEGTGNTSTDLIISAPITIFGTQYSWVPSTPDGGYGIWFNNDATDTSPSASYATTNFYSIMNNTPRTYNMWINIGSPCNNNAAHCSILYAGGSSSPNIGSVYWWFNVYTGAGNLYFSGHILDFATPNYTEYGSWAMLTFIYNGTASFAYINGTLFVSQEQALVTDEWVLTLASNRDISSFGNYTIDNLAVFEEALNQANLSLLYNNGVPLPLQPANTTQFKNVSLLSTYANELFLVPPSNTSIYAIFETINTTITNVSGNIEVFNSFENNSPTNWSYVLLSTNDTLLNLTQINATDIDGNTYQWNTFLQVNWTTPTPPIPNTYSNDNVSIRYYYFAHTNTQNSSLNLIVFVGAFVFILGIIAALYYILTRQEG